MDTVADFLARVIAKGENPTSVAQDVTAFRRDFDTLHFVHGA